MRRPRRGAGAESYESEEKECERTENSKNKTEDESASPEQEKNQREREAAGQDVAESRTKTLDIWHLLQSAQREHPPVTERTQAAIKAAAHTSVEPSTAPPQPIFRKAQTTPAAAIPAHNPRLRPPCSPRHLPPYQP